MKKHPVIYGLGFSAVMIPIALVTKNVNCPPYRIYDGQKVPYNGTSPGCPKPEYGTKK